MRKTIIYKHLKKEGDTLEIAVGFEKPYLRRKETKYRGGRRSIFFYPLPSLMIASTDNPRIFKGNVCQTTIHLMWLFFYVYLETFRTVDGSSIGKKLDRILNSF